MPLKIELILPKHDARSKATSIIYFALFPYRDDYVDNGLLDDGQKPNRWNKCRFRCDICGKAGSEKRVINYHILKVSNLYNPDHLLRNNI